MPFPTVPLLSCGMHVPLCFHGLKPYGYTSAYGQGATTSCVLLVSDPRWVYTDSEVSCLPIVVSFLTPAVRNLLSTSEQELSCGRFTGSFDLCEQWQINRVGIIPKSHTPGIWRLITDLSNPMGVSVNDRIDPDINFAFLRHGERSGANGS